MNILIIDDHDVILKGTIQAFQEKYKAPKITTALTANEARTKFSGLQDLDLIVLDLSLPNHANEQPTPNVGIELMKDFLKSESMPNILVLSTNIKPVVRLKALINAYGGGVTMMDKGQSTEDMLQMADIALRGSICWPQQVKGWLTKEAFRKEFDMQWIEVLKLRVHEGLHDKAIAKRLHVTERTVRNYWVRLQDNLCLASDPEKDFHMQIYIAAKELGLLD